MEEKKLTNESIFKIITIIVSLTFTLFLVELGVGKYLLNEGNKKIDKCGEDHLAKFTNSRGFSLINAYYQPYDEVRHCDLEYDYFYHINKDGLREDPRNYDVGDDREVLAVGDSFTFGFGVEDDESFPALLDANNAGLWGDPFDIQIMSFKRGVKLFKPKIVIWGIYPSHLITMTPDHWEKNCPGDSIYLQGDSFLPKLAGKTASWVVNTSSIGRLVLKKNFIKNFEFREGGLRIEKDCYQTKEVLLYDKNLENNNFTGDKEVNKSFAADLDEVYAKLGSYFAEAKEISEEEDIDVILFIIPSRMQLKLKEGSLRLPYENVDIDPDLSSTRISNLILQAGFSKSDIVDLSKYFLEEDDWTNYYYEIDAHWNSKGHKFVAEVLKTIIMNKSSNSARSENE